ncbi:NAD(P)/FAD-dependent oxidoreductase [Caldilinea sp.]|jgi:NADH dehydrogenase|uniref:NAD(P)/FAD-dependent oxidoreductase n=1 Tax=Caldilinea sp. TaxID=2293560 RepID=UPI00261FCE07|nr:NAD(P)/FAD-dependent oxidoreductase [uncultured Caldilinea sp.]
MPEAPRVAIVGAGFGGLWAARALAHTPVQVLLLDRNNYHTFLPLLYQVAAAELEPEAIAYPVRSILRRMPNVSFALAEVRQVDLNSRRLETSAGAISYDFLILAAGSAPHFFGTPGAETHALPLKSMADAIAVRNRVLLNYEKASLEPNPERRRQTLTFVIVGGGPTGVEFAGALAELMKGPLRRDFPSLRSSPGRVVLVEAMDALLPGFPPRLQTYAAERLRRMGVEVLLRAPVTRVTENTVTLKDGTHIDAETVVWTAGVQGISPAAHWGLPTARSGRVAVLPTLQTPNHPEVYVIGDLAYVEQDGSPLPMVAPVAIQQGRFAAQNVLRQLWGQQPLPFRYRDQGAMVTIGRNAAVVQLRNLEFTGFPAWILWLSVHLFNLVGFRNRLLVMLNWAWDYFFFERTVRLILP